MSAAPELAIVPPSNAPAPEMGAGRVVTLDLDNAALLQQMLARFRDEYLVSGVDYGIIPSTPRATLYKPGAEKLMEFFKLSLEIEILNRVEDWDKFVAYEVKAILRSKRGREIEAEGVGNCNSKERKYKNQDAANVANTILKMAKKRAFLDAILTATRSSGLFLSEDGDDCDSRPAPRGGRPENAPRPNQNQRPQVRPQVTQNAGEAVLSPAQWERCETARKRAIESGFQSSPGKVPSALRKNTPVRIGWPLCQKWEAFARQSETELAEDLGEETAAQAIETELNEAKADKRGPKYRIPKFENARNCTSCGAQIWFIKAPDTGATIPVGADGYSHFTSCPNASQHSHKNTPKKEVVAAEPGYAGATPANATPANATPAPQIGMSNAQKRLWAVIGKRGLPQAKEGAARDERLELSNQALESGNFAPVVSFTLLSDSQAACLVTEIEAGRLAWGQSADQSQEVTT